MYNLGIALLETVIAYGQECFDAALETDAEWMLFVLEDTPDEDEPDWYDSDYGDDGDYMPEKERPFDN